MAILNSVFYNDSKDFLPDDAHQATLVGRVWSIASGGPSVMLIDDGVIYDVSTITPTVSHLFNSGSALRRVRFLDRFHSRKLGTLDEWLSFSKKACENPGKRKLNRILAPCDLQSVKAFTESGNGRKDKVELLTKDQALSALGCMENISLDPENSCLTGAELVLAINGRGEAVGCALGTSVTAGYRPGSTASMQLARASHNVIGPFIRLFDENFSIHDALKSHSYMHVKGPGRLNVEVFDNTSHVVTDVLNKLQMVADKYTAANPDGYMLYTGLMSDVAHNGVQSLADLRCQQGDIIKLGNDKLGCMYNQIICQGQTQGSFGIGDLFNNLAQRGYLCG